MKNKKIIRKFTVLLAAQMCIRDRRNTARARSTALPDGETPKILSPTSVSYTHLDVYKRQVNNYDIGVFNLGYLPQGDHRITTMEK